MSIFYQLKKYNIYIRSSIFFKFSFQNATTKYKLVWKEEDYLLSYLAIYSRVKLGIDPITNQKIAIKIFQNNHLNSNQSLYNEINVLKQLNHPNIINLIEFDQNMQYTKKNGEIQERICAYLELATRGELFEYVTQKKRFRPEMSRFYFKQILESLNYMKIQGICHRDLKLENLLLDENFNLKITDFGFSTYLSRGQLHTNLGTPGYKAPEIISHREYNGTLVDIFSTGVILFILYVGSPPFSKASENDSLYRFLILNNCPKFWQAHAKYQDVDITFFNSDFKNLIEGMLNPIPELRYNIDQCQKHPWTNGQTATLYEVQNYLSNTIQYQNQNQIASIIPINQQLLNISPQNINLQRETENCMLNELFCYESPEEFIQRFIGNINKIDSTVKTINNNDVKIHIDVTDEQIIQVQVRLRKIAKKKVAIHIQRIKGDYFKYHKISHKLKTVINEL